MSLYGDDPRAKAVTQSVLENTLAVILRLLHPFMPFITEEIWHYLHPEGTADGSGSLIVAPWPAAGERDREAEDFFSELIEAIRGVRNIRAEYDVEPGRYIPATMVGRRSQRGGDGPHVGNRTIGPRATAYRPRCSRRETGAIRVGAH